jgi:hypothetical protein
MVLVSSAIISSPSAAYDDWKLDASAEFDTGKYGTGTRTNSLDMPFVLKHWWGDDWSGSVTVPILVQSGNGSAVRVGGKLVRIGGGNKTRGGGAVTTESGLGDILLKAGYDLLSEDHRAPFDLTLVARTKLPTASSAKGLGTGEFDQGFGVQFDKEVSGDWTVLLDLYYTFIGSPPGQELQNETAWDFGFSHLVDRDEWLTLLFEGSNALVEGTSAPRDLRATIDNKLDAETKVYFGGLVGLSQGSPQLGLLVGANRRF